MKHERKPIPEEHLTVVLHVFEEWAKRHDIDVKKVSDEHKMLAARIASWVDRRSIAAGVHDVMAFMPYKFKEMKREIIEQQLLDLSERMIKAITQNNLLTASLKRGAGMGG